MSSLRVLSIALAISASVGFPTARAAGEAVDYARQDNWHSVCGLSQSPIDIVTAHARAGDAAEPQGIDLRATRTALKTLDNGHAIEVEVKGPDAMIRGRHFALSQFHFHAPGEHTIDGHRYPVEAHFVFKAEDGRLAVVAVMYETGAANTVATAVLDNLAATHADRVDIAGLLPARKDYYRYLGSLTTPPLNETVEWYVLATPMTLSADQIAAFKRRHDNNNRRVQPLNDRPLIHFAG